MKILWWRILAVAVALELLYGGFLYQVLGDPMLALEPVGLASVFVFMAIGGALIGWMAKSRRMLQGALVGVTAVIFYTVLTIPPMVSGELVLTPGYFVNHLCKLLGAGAGGAIAAMLARPVRATGEAEQGQALRD